MKTTKPINEKKCCNRVMEAKGICWSEDKGFGESDYAICLQCKKCGRIKIINKTGEENGR